MAKKNRTICIVEKDGYEYVHEYDGGFYRSLVELRGLIGAGKKQYVCSVAYLVDGEGCIMSVTNFAYGRIPRTPEEAEIKAAFAQIPKAEATPPTDPVEQAKRKGKEMKKAYDEAAKAKPKEEPDNIHFPTPEPWREPLTAREEEVEL